MLHAFEKWDDTSGENKDPKFAQSLSEFLSAIQGFRHGDFQWQGSTIDELKIARVYGLLQCPAIRMKIKKV
jgi:hypothetical protein